MSQQLQTNLAIIERRWPAFAAAIEPLSFDHLQARLLQGKNQTISVNGIQLSGCHDRLAEAQLFIDQLPKLATRAGIYGVGMGDVPTSLVLEQQLSHIDVYPLNLPLFKLLITYTDQTQWLADKRVTLHLDADPYAIAQHRVAITADLVLADESHAHVRDLLVQENQRDFTNRHHTASPEILERIEQTRPYIEQDNDAANLVKPQQHRVFVIGAGPTLESHYAYLQQQQALTGQDKPFIICADTAYKALNAHDIIPDIVVTVDDKIVPAHFGDVLPETIPLVYFPRTPSRLLEAWQGPRYAAYSPSGLYDALATQLPRLRLFVNGSVIHPVTDLAIKFAPQSIHFFGCDFCYPHNKSHAFWQDGHLGPSATIEKKHWLLNGYGDKVGTDLNFRSYLRSLEQLISQYPGIAFYQTSLHSAAISGAQYQEC